MEKRADDKVKKIAIISSLFVIPLSIVFIVMGVNTMKLRSYLREVCTEQTDGIVYDYRILGTITSDEDGTTDNRTYIPLFEYVVEGKAYTYEADFSESKQRFELGQKVTVNYNPDNHSECYVPEYNDGGGKAYFLIGLGALLLALYITALYINLKPKKTR